MSGSGVSPAEAADVAGLANRLEWFEARQRRLFVEVRLVAGLVVLLIVGGVYVSQFGTVAVRSVQATRIVVSDPKGAVLMLPHIIQVASASRPGDPAAQTLRVSLESRRDGVVFVLYDDRGEPYYAVNTFPERLREYYPSYFRTGAAEARMKEVSGPAGERPAPSEAAGERPAPPDAGRP